MQDRFMSKQELNNYFKAMRELKVKCKCGHSVVMLPEYKYRICTFCGAKILPKRETFKEGFTNYLLKRGDVNVLIKR